MSLDIKVYVGEISDDLISQIVSRLNGFEMICEISADFSFKDKSGFLPFRFRLTNSHLNVLKNKDLLSGFELYIGDFDFESEKREFNEGEESNQPFVNTEIDEKLQDCKKELTFVWNVADSFEFRFASLTSAIITELTDGVCCYPADEIWYENSTIVKNAWEEIKQFELSLKERDLRFHEFDKWQ